MRPCLLPTTNRGADHRPGRPGQALPPHRAGAGGRAHRPARPRNGREPCIAGGTLVAGYVLRPAPPDPEFAPALEWILIGDALRHDFALCRAWDVASGLGLGPQRRRFHLRRTVALRPDGQVVEHAAPWPLSECAVGGLEQTQGRPTRRASCPRAVRELAPDQPCRLVFPSPLRLLFRKRLIEAPTLADIVVAACRRVKVYLPADQHTAWDDVARQALETARRTPAGAWQGERLDLRRYSARQHAELELRGVTGCLDLPHGPGELWPLLAAATWLHLGKGTVMGLGQMVVEG